MKVALFAKVFSESNLSYANSIISKLNQVSERLIIYKPFYDFLSDHIPIPEHTGVFSTHTDLAGNADYLVSVGGDGTFLGTLPVVRQSGIPVIGINTGRLGFLSSVPKEEASKAIDDLVSGKFSVEKRSLVQVDHIPHFGEINYGLNEFTLLKKDSSMITIHVYINDIYLNSYWADGLIIATPTGSTAYSLSCGGPVVSPESENFIISPIAPHHLNVRPIVIPDSGKIRLKIESRNDQALAALDSRSAVIDVHTEFTVSKCDFKYKLVRLHDQNFPAMLRNKLMWGIDKRN